MQKMLNEHDIRRELCRHIRRTNWKRSDALISEYFVENASRRADLVAANGHLTAYEIKSDRDHLGRLQGQIEVFSRCFEAVTVVCTERHLEGVLSMTAKEVGVTCVSKEGVIVVRDAVVHEINSLDIWLSHLPLIAIREILTNQAIKCPRSNRNVIIAIAKKYLSVSEVRAAVLRYVKTTKRLQRIALIQEKLAMDKIDPLLEHRRMLRDYLESRGIAHR
jgi:hypothetical protein